MALCINGKEGAQYSCYFCAASLHRPEELCGCSTHRTKLVSGWCPVCPLHAEILDLLYGDTELGKVHQCLVEKGRMEFMRGSD